MYNCQTSLVKALNKWLVHVCIAGLHGATSQVNLVLSDHILTNSVYIAERSMSSEFNCQAYEGVCPQTTYTEHKTMAWTTYQPDHSKMRWLQSCI